MTAPIEVPEIEARAVLDSSGHVLLFDLWVAGRWVGSRRTPRQCEEWLSHLCGAAIEAAPDSPW